ncbi:hypothetical protein K502DRAFT_322642 [Neoconidiobolus thromboides FSU 785]|nr:hypothetical protein K502DRAFT_322642 [Neoconidiobolus thromboides FSU 785]
MKCPINIASNFLNLSNLKPIQLVALHQHLNKIKGMGGGASKTQKEITIPYMPSQKDIQNLLFSAEEQYFLFINPVIPLFLRSNLQFKKRDPLLRFVIWIRGLQILKITKATKWLLDQLIPILMDKVKLSRIKPSLSSIQILVICYYTARWTKIKGTNVTNYLEIALSMCYQLGFHMPLSNKVQYRHTNVEIERFLAFNTILKLSGFLNLSLNYSVYNVIPIPPTVSKKKLQLCCYDRLVIQISLYYNQIYKSIQSISKKRAASCIRDNKTNKEIQEIFNIQNSLDTSYRNVFKKINLIHNKFINSHHSTTLVNNNTNNNNLQKWEQLFFGQIGCLINYLHIYHQTIKLFGYKSNYKHSKDSLHMAYEIETCSLKILDSALGLGPYQTVSVMIYSITTSLSQLKCLKTFNMLKCSIEVVDHLDDCVKGILKHNKSLICHPVLLFYFSLALGDIKAIKWAWPASLEK